MVCVRGPLGAFPLFYMISVVKNLFRLIPSALIGSLYA